MKFCSFFLVPCCVFSIFLFPLLFPCIFPLFMLWKCENLSQLNPYLINTFLTLLVPCISESLYWNKIKLNLYFRTSFCCLKRFYEGLQGLHKTFYGTTKKCKNKYLTWFSSSRIGTERVKLQSVSQKLMSYLWILNLRLVAVKSFRIG